MSIDAVIARLDAIMPRLDEQDRKRDAARKEHRQELQRVENGLLELTKTLNGRLSKIESERLREEGQRAEVARAAAEVKAAKEDRQRSLAWKIKVAAGASGALAGLVTAAGVLAQLIYHH